MSDRIILPDGEDEFVFNEPYASGQVSDGFHTFDELYRYRLLYNAALMNFVGFANEARLTEWEANRVHKSKLHSDGKHPFDDPNWFIVMMYIPGQGQISNHYEMKDWDLFDIPELHKADKWDGHTAEEAADRIERWLRSIAGSKQS